MKNKVLRVLSGLVGIFLIMSTFSLALSGLPKDFFDFSAYLGGVLLGGIFLIYAVKGKSLVDKSD